MREIEHLQKQWRDSARFRGLHASMSLERDALVLGANTVLAKRDRDGALAINGKEEKLLTLLSVAHGRPIDASILKSLRRASDCAKAGDACLASMHVALALPALRDPVDASRRLFVADGLLAKGVRPRDIWIALEIDALPLDALEKEYNPNQPRVPAGSGRPSGRWTSGGAMSDAKGPIPGAAVRTARQITTRAAEESALEAEAELPIADSPAWLALLSRVAPPTAFLAALLYSTPAGGKHHEGDVLGRPDLRYSWDEDGIYLYVTRKSDGQIVLRATPSPNGTFLVGQKKTVGRLVGNDLLLVPSAIPTPQSKSPEKPDLCPAKDYDKLGRQGAQGKKDKDYEDYVKRIINPDNPTPRGFGYQLPNPEKNGKLVFYDDCQHETGMMVEAKGTGYAAALAKPDGFMKKVYTADWLDQAERQVAAAGVRPIEWHFAEKEAADYARQLFSKREDLQRIVVVYTYWREGMK
jgi:hypothetical protein